MIVENEYFIYQPFDSESYKNLVSSRVGEKKIGENLSNSQEAQFVIIGVEEDFGPQHNFGRPGADKAFSAFLNTFLNSQSNEFLTGNEFFIAGSIKVKHQYAEVQQIKNLINFLDELVLSIVSYYIQQGKIPIVIGGGHNNAYPLISASKQNYPNLHVINLDAHADIRACDYRHSGNPFSFALNEHLLSSYTVFGLHKSFNNQFIIDELKEKNIQHTYFEDYLFEKRNLIEDLIHFTISNKNTFVGIELDMDSIEYFPSSALSPSGFTVNEARKYVQFLAENLNNIAYLHLPEAAPTSIEEQKIVGKTLTYLVSDFIRTMKLTNDKL
ncbi:MAG: formimidoylglutamase [Flavobacteriia bacterium]|nr:formimidoylglutamase [Flavobacteriia bacterium]